MNLVNRKSQIANRSWLPDMDLNHDKQIQSLLCYRYTIGQSRASKIGVSQKESRPARNQKWSNGVMECWRPAVTIPALVPVTPSFDYSSFPF